MLDARLTKARVLAEARVLVKLGALRGNGVVVPAVLGLEWDVGRGVKRAEGATRVRRGGMEDEGEQATASAQGQKGAWILMEFIEGMSVKELLRGVDAYIKSRGDTITSEECGVLEVGVKDLLRRIGRAVGAMHSMGGVVHGDLTTSNIMVRPRKQDTVAVNGHGQHANTEQGETTSCPDLRGEIVLIDFGLATQSIQDEDRAVDLYVLERAFGSTHPRQEDWFNEEVLEHRDGYLGSFKGASVVLKRLGEVRLRGRKRSMIG